MLLKFYGSYGTAICRTVRLFLLSFKVNARKSPASKHWRRRWDMSAYLIQKTINQFDFLSFLC
nr:MAG TPA: hypothetical protein [Caudoviricetes sp.]